MFKNKNDGRNNLCGEKIRELRLNHPTKLSQRALADKMQLIGIDVDKNAIQRIECGKRFTTYEKIESLPIIVIKKDKTRELFDREKLLAGITRACEKRPVETSKLDMLVDRIESDLQNTLKREISTKEIGEKVMDGLKDIDEVAYVRFASVYRQFKDINTFIAEVNKLLTDKTN